MAEVDKRPFEVSAAKHWDQWLANAVVEEVLPDEAMAICVKPKEED